MLKDRINSCYRDLLFSRNKKYMKAYIEGFRSRLDELILMYHCIENISFIDACEKLEVNYQDVNAEPTKEIKR